MKHLIEDEVNENELEALYGGSGSGADCTVRLNCTSKWFSDEDNDENIVF